MGLTGIHWAIIKCAVVCFAVILAVIILRVYHSPLGPSISRWYYRAYVDDAILTSLHPANLSSTTSSSSIRYQLSLNITFKTVSYGAAGYRDCSATAWYKDTMLDAPPEIGTRIRARISRRKWWVVFIHSLFFYPLTRVPLNLS